MLADVPVSVVILVMVLLAEGRDVRPYVVSAVRAEKNVMQV